MEYTAKRANGEQCTLSILDECEYCGTPPKGTPHGTIDNEDSDITIIKVFRYLQRNIRYCVTCKLSYYNVYNTEKYLTICVTVRFSEFVFIFLLKTTIIHQLIYYMVAYI